jgi:hypothetical protein
MTKTYVCPVCKKEAELNSTTIGVIDNDTGEIHAVYHLKCAANSGDPDLEQFAIDTAIDDENYRDPDYLSEFPF